MRRRDVERCGFGSRINTCRCPDRCLLPGTKRPYSGQCRRDTGWLETWMARTSLDATVRRDAPKDNNPVELTEQNLLNGVHLFAQNCAVCHGSAKGAAASSPIAKGLYQKPPQLATDGVEDDPEGVSFWKIKHGIRLTGMPSFG